MRSYRKRPSRLSSALAVVVGIGMLIFALSQFSSRPGIGSGSVPGSFGGGFMIFWGVGLIGIIGYHAYNAITGKGYSDSIDLVDEDERNPNRHESEVGDRRDEGKSIETRLKELKGLRDRGLITDDEFAEKRCQILDDI